MNRREMLASVFGAGVSLLLAKPLSERIGEEPGGAGSKRWAMVIDVSKCYGCYACLAACAAENNVPIGVFRTWIERYVKTEGGVVFVPKMCNHCEEPSCVEVCPVNATYKAPNGEVLVDDSVCIGCGACVQNCPYGARFFNPVKGVADKCTLCSHRIYEGKLPACVEACPTGARIFGDVNDPDSEVSKIVRESSFSRWKPWTGNKPMTFYIGMPEEANR
ncbi:Tetrathionate reductase subunit B [archaeon HR01]|nr:Tetrathionate reductase subunit B [archaeon HR01]